MIGREDEIRRHREKAKKYYTVVLFFFGLLVSRLVYLQIFKGEELKKFSDSNRLKKEKLTASRGILFDRDGKILVDNRASFDVILLSQYYSFNEKENQRLATVLGMDLKDLERKLAKVNRVPSYYPILMKADVTKDVLAGIEMDTDGFKGVDIEANVQRRYPFGDMAAQVFGYLGEVDPKDLIQDKKLLSGDYIGKSGLERYYDSELRGRNGVGYVEVDAMGRRKKTEGAEKLLGFVSQTEPLSGNNFYLTLDLDLELAAANALKSRNYNGTVVALDPRNGEVLALVNYPSYDPQKISGREVNPKIWAQLLTDKDKPLRNRAIQDHYPPGSTFKLLVAIAALAEGIVNPQTTMNCYGHLPFGRRNFNCWKKHGTIDFVKAIQQSCDVFFYNLGIQLGIDKISKYARLFGLGSRTGIKLRDEQPGLIPDSEWKKKRFGEAWQPGETLSVAIGQGYVDVTPLQLAMAYSAIANNGFLYRPYLVRKIESRTGEISKEFKPELVRKIDVPNEVFNVVKEGLMKVVNEPGGTAFASRSNKTIISGKTGTAQVRAFADISKAKCENLTIKDRHHGLFVGFAPKENPEIVVMAIAEHGCHGSAAAHVVKDVIETYMVKKVAKEADVKNEIPNLKNESVQKQSSSIPSVGGQDEEE